MTTAKAYAALQQALHTSDITKAKSQEHGIAVCRGSMHVAAAIAPVTPDHCPGSVAKWRLGTRA